MKNAILYATKVWLTAVVLGPLVYYLLYGYWVSGSERDFSVILLILVFGAMFSIPSWLALILIVWLFNRSTFTDGFKKGLLIAISALLTWLPFVVAGMSQDGELVVLAAVYWILIALGLWFYALVPALPASASAPLDQIP